MVERHDNLDVSTFKIYKEVTDDKIDALFRKIEGIDDKLDTILINQAQDRALAIIGKWCLIIIPAISAVFAAITMWRK